jgi:hypothetical protein
MAFWFMGSCLGCTRLPSNSKNEQWIYVLTITMVVKAIYRDTCSAKMLRG